MNNQQNQPLSHAIDRININITKVNNFAYSDVFINAINMIAIGFDSISGTCTCTSRIKLKKLVDQVITQIYTHENNF